MLQANSLHTHTHTPTHTHTTHTHTHTHTHTRIHKRNFYESLCVFSRVTFQSESTFGLVGYDHHDNRRFCNLKEGTMYSADLDVTYNLLSVIILHYRSAKSLDEC